MDFIRFSLQIVNISLNNVKNVTTLSVAHRSQSRKLPVNKALCLLDTNRWSGVVPWEPLRYFNEMKAPLKRESWHIKSKIKFADTKTL
jgi:hypothetical protein